MDKFVRLVERRRGVLRLTAEDFFSDAGIHEKTFANAKRDLWMTEKTFSKLLDAMQLEESSEKIVDGVFGEEFGDQGGSHSQDKVFPPGHQKSAFKSWFTGVALLIAAFGIGTLTMLGARNSSNTVEMDSSVPQPQEMAQPNEDALELANQFRLKLQNAKKSEEIACTSAYCVVATSKSSLICDEAVTKATLSFAGQSLDVPRFACSQNDADFLCVRVKEGLRIGASRELQVGFQLLDGSVEVTDVKVGGIVDFPNNETFVTDGLFDGIGIYIQTRCRE